MHYKYYFIKILQQVKKPLVSQAECKRAYSNAEITPRMFCAGRPEGGIDSCQGDSGGPLVCKKSSIATGKDVWYIWGVISWGAGCAEPGYYGVYSAVHSMASWIKNIAFQ